MFNRRFFYDLTTGEELLSRVVSGRAIVGPAGEEAAAYSLENWGLMEWNEPDGATEAAFSPYDESGAMRTVTVSVLDGELVFEYEAVTDAQGAM